jgi:hypothetical protein
MSVNALIVASPKCKVESCPKPHCGRKGFCDPHYRHYMKYGDPLGGTFTKPKLLLTDIAGVQNYLIDASSARGECWIWKGHKNQWGYGVCQLEGRARLAHRVSASAFNGFDLTSAFLVCHTCDVPACINPNHLFIGTNQDNTEDKLRKGRGRWISGERVNTAKLKAQTVLMFRALHAEGWKPGKIAVTFGVNRCTINDILKRRSWKQL